VVLDGYDLPEAPAREAELARLMMGESRADGLGGDHDQLNKAVVVWPAGEHTFRFRDYQIIERSGRRLVGDLECPHAASAAAVFALLRGHVQLDVDGALEALNEGTGQRILLRPEDAGAFWEGPWHVRFLPEPGSVPCRPSGSAPLSLVATDGGVVRFWVVEQGNVFSFAEVEPARIDAELGRRLEAATRAVALKRGSDPGRAASPEVIAYSLGAVDELAIHAAVTCFYNGELQTSLPGSAAMCFAAFLAGRHLDRIPGEHERGALVVHLHHGSGNLPVTVHWTRHHGEDRIAATELTTSVRLLLRGAAMRPAVAAGA